LKLLFVFGVIIMGLFTPVLGNASDLTEGENIMYTSKPNAYQYSFKSAGDGDIDLKDFEGKVILVVNTASKCGFTGQYKELQALYEKYKDDGLVVLGVPSADFAGQEFGSIEEVKDFTEENFSVTFPLTDISHVKGSDAHPFYKWAGDHTGFLGGVKWNFHKYLIGKNGDFVKSFGSTTSPISAKMVKAIEAELKK